MGRKLANGFLCFGPATFVSAAFILSQFASRGCKFIEIDEPDDDQDEFKGIFDRNSVAYAGVYCFQTEDGSNYLYNDGANFSSAHTLARNMAYATTIMGAIAWCFYVLASCLRFPPTLWFLISLTLLATCVCEGLTFKWLTSDTCNVLDCELATSSKCGIAACVFWFLSALMTCGVFKDAQNQDE